MPCLEDRLGLLSPSELSLYSRLTDAFESAWTNNGSEPPELERFLPKPLSEPLSSLVLVPKLEG